MCPGLSPKVTHGEEQVLGCAAWDRETTAVKVMALVSEWVS